MWASCVCVGVHVCACGVRKKNGPLRCSCFTPQICEFVYYIAIFSHNSFWSVSERMNVANQLKIKRQDYRELFGWIQSNNESLKVEQCTGSQIHVIWEELNLPFLVWKWKKGSQPKEENGLWKQGTTLNSEPARKKDLTIITAKNEILLRTWVRQNTNSQLDDPERSAF